MLIRLGFILILLGVVTLWLPRLVTARYAWSRLFGVEDVPVERVAIVFGAGLRWDGTPSPVLRDRVATAAQLYSSGKVRKLLMSGDNRFLDYNEPGAMRDFAIQLGVPAGDIVLDFAGRRTYDTCFRARDIFQVKSAILVTQSFHLPRAIYVCNILGVPAVGVPADQRSYRRPARLFWNLRETLATLIALWEVHVSKPLPVLGDPEPIFPLEAS
ncbi:MAG TPA: ElyC/SanA/YdcF family protein [Anaerolineales bacterium]|jgi:SanA protein|nr:ElyC/SanA/YdcF family protein [Anaerolineales bacterium]